MNLFSEHYLVEKIEKALVVLKMAKEKNAILSLSGGRDGTVIEHIARMNGVGFTEICANLGVESEHNRKFLKSQIKEYGYKFYPMISTRSYKEIIYNFGFPIQNKNFSQLCSRAYRDRNDNNWSDGFRLVMGYSPVKDYTGVTISNRYRLDLKFWHFARKVPLQSYCCDVLKKEPMKKLKRNSVIGIMKDDSPERRKAILESFGDDSVSKFYPLGDWNKRDIATYVEMYDVKVSDTYKDREYDNFTIVGASSSGCDFCHFGNKDGHFYRNEFGEKIETTKFENLKRERPKAYNRGMSMKYKNGMTFADALEFYYKSLNGDFIEESILARDAFIDGILQSMPKELIQARIDIENAKGRDIPKPKKNRKSTKKNLNHNQGGLF